MRKRKIKITTKDEIKNAILEAYEKIEMNKQKNNLSSDFIKTPLILFFRIISVFCAIFGILFIVTLITMFRENKILNITDAIISIVFMAIVFVLVILFSIYFSKISKEIKVEKDVQYLLTYFSAVVSLLALIISFVGLIK